MRNFTGFLKGQKGQTFIEYTIILGVIVGLLFAMTPLVKRETQAMIKIVADQVGVQKNAEQEFGDGGYMKSSSSDMQVSKDKQTQETGGSTRYTFDDETRVSSVTDIDLGVRELVAP